MPRQMLSEPVQNQEIGLARSAVDRATSRSTTLTDEGSFEKRAAERGFSAGRGAFKFNPPLVRAWGGGEKFKQWEDDWPGVGKSDRVR